MPCSDFLYRAACKWILMLGCGAFMAAAQAAAGDPANLVQSMLPNYLLGLPDQYQQGAAQQEHDPPLDAVTTLRLLLRHRQETQRGKNETAFGSSA